MTALKKIKVGLFKGIIKWINWALNAGFFMNSIQAYRFAHIPIGYDLDADTQPTTHSLTVTMLSFVNLKYALTLKEAGMT